jgi:cell wall-associated NlpC family hydrolase
MKRSLALTVLLLLCVLLASTAFARKKRHSSKAKSKPHISCYTDCKTDTISPYNLLYLAQSLIGTPYRDASSDPLHGFDCSGFVSYVFKSFNAVVPRSSSDYAYAGREINIQDARPGDIILFKGTKSHHPHSIGHIGIIYSNDSNDLKFIHSTSGKEYCVTINSLDDTYKRRFVKVVRLLRQNDNFQAPIFQAQVN